MTIVHRYRREPETDDHRWTAAVIVTTCHVRPTDWTNESAVAAGLLTDVEVTTESSARHLSNVLRYRALHRHGGLWLDNDVIPLVDLTTSTDPWVAAVGDGYEGCAMWFPEPGHPALVELTRRIAAAPASASPPQRSGAELLDRVARAHGIRQNRAVCPFGSNGQRNGSERPQAVHTWTSSRGAVLNPDQNGATT